MALWACRLLVAKTFIDNLTEVIVGARPLADLDSIVGEWQSGDGHHTRAELEQAIATG